MKTLGRRKGSLSGLPRKTVQARRVTQAVDSRNRPTQPTYVLFDALNCTVQPYVGKDLSVLEDGFNHRSIYTVFTDTLCRISSEGTSELSDELQIDGVWHKVVKVKAWQVGVISHYELTVVQKDEVNNAN